MPKLRGIDAALHEIEGTATLTAEGSAVIARHAGVTYRWPSKDPHWTIAVFREAAWSWINRPVDARERSA